ncbi:MAG TPA: putative lipid II flippase FtsW [Streptosporangiaceae bacterium]|nr:putative lipid II flippase FtsW [Streptosporangiaceae bacterium]
MSAAGARPHGVRALVSAFDRPLTSYYLLIGATGLLVAIGLVMVLSTSSATQLYSHSPEYSVFVKQLEGATAGLLLMWALSKAPPRLFRAVARPMLVASLIGLVLVLGFGKTVAGSTRWISIAGFQFQPSELAKLAFLLWGADLLARKEKLGQLTDARTLLMPLLPGAAVLGLLVMLGRDLGTTFLLLAIFLALLWVVGTPGRIFVGMLGLLGFAGLMVVLVASYGQGRITCFLHPQSQATGNCWQLINGKDAIGSGSLFGVGLGSGTEKWGWVPNASTDFIFAILGEELGLAGTACVVLLYGGLAYAGLRVARRVTDPFMRLAAGGATAWIVTQALVNIGEVIGLVPITGVPLPLISAGVSSLLATMAAIGMLLSFARCEPGARQALAARGPGRAQRAIRRLGLGGPGLPAGPGGVPARPDRERLARRQGPGSPQPGQPQSQVPSKLAGPGDSSRRQAQRAVGSGRVRAGSGPSRVAQGTGSWPTGSGPTGSWPTGSGPTGSGQTGSGPQPGAGPGRPQPGAGPGRPQQGAGSDRVPPGTGSGRVPPGTGPRATRQREGR